MQTERDVKRFPRGHLFSPQQKREAEERNRQPVDRTSPTAEGDEATRRILICAERGRNDETSGAAEVGGAAKRTHFTEVV